MAPEKPSPLISLILLVLGGLILFIDYTSFQEFFHGPTFQQQLDERAEMARWPSVPGQLVKVRIGAWPSKRSVHFFAQGEYRYVVDGKERRGKELSIDGYAYQSESFEDFKRKVSGLAPGLAFPRPPSHGSTDYPVNLSVNIHVDPKNPDRSILNNQDARPLTWQREVANPLYWGICFGLLGLRLVFSALIGLVSLVGNARRKSPGVLHESPDGSKVFGLALPWLWLVNIAGLLMFGLGWSAGLEAFTPIPGESLGCFTAVFMGGVVLAFGLAGFLLTLAARPELQLRMSDRTLRESFRHALLPFVKVPTKVRRLEDFDHVELSAGPSRKKAVAYGVDLVGRDGKTRISLLWDAAFEWEARSMAQCVAAATGLRLETVAKGA